MPIPAILHPLRWRAFRRLWIGQSLSALGNGMFPVALALLLLQRPHGTTELGLVLAAQSAANIGLVFFGGHFTDRFGATRMMLAADLLRMFAAGALAVLGTGGSLAAYVILAALMGGGAALFDPAERSLLPTLVPEEGLQPANAMNSVTARVGTVLGAPLAGILVASVGPGVAFTVDAASFVASLMGVIGVRLAGVRGKQAHAEGSEYAGMLGGLTAVRQRPWAAATMIQGAIQVLCCHAPLIVLIPLALQANQQQDSYGLLLGLQSLGGALGAALVASRRFRHSGTVAMVSLLTGLPLIGLLVAGSATPLLAAAMVLMGIGGSVFVVLWLSALQRNMPKGALGKVMALDFVTQLGLEPLGFAITAPMVAHFGLSSMLIFCAASLVITTAGVFLVPGVTRFGDRSVPSTTPAPATA